MVSITGTRCCTVVTGANLQFGTAAIILNNESRVLRHNLLESNRIH